MIDAFCVARFAERVNYYVVLPFNSDGTVETTVAGAIGKAMHHILSIFVF